MKGVFFDVILTLVSLACVVASIIYLRAMSASNTALLKDSVAILFLSKINKYIFNIIIGLTLK